MNSNRRVKPSYGARETFAKKIRNIEAIIQLYKEDKIVAKEACRRIYYVVYHKQRYDKTSFDVKITNKQNANQKTE